MAADWVKIRNKYIHSTMSQSDLAKKYKVSTSAIKEKCRAEGWVEERKKQQAIRAEKLNQKTAEKLIEKDSNNVAKVQEITERLLESVIQAVKELGTTELHNKRQIRKTKDLGAGEREEKTETKEYLERVESAIDITRVQSITSALKNILEINAMVGGEGLEESDAFNDLMLAIGGLNETK